METEVLRGEIYLVDMRKVTSAERTGICPVLVIQSDIGNAQSSTVIVASITKKMDKPTLPTHVAVDTSCGLRMDSVVRMEQIRTIKKCCLGKYIGILNEKQMQEIDKAISASVSNEMVKHMFTEKDNQVLCPACAAALRDSGEHIVLRANPFQIEREACSICNKPDSRPNGYDYFVKKK